MIRRSSLSRTPPIARDLLASVFSYEASHTTREETAETEDNVFWNDDEETSPIYKLQEDSLREPFTDKAKSPNKKRKRETQVDIQEGISTSEMADVINAIQNLTKKTEKLDKQVKKSTKTKLQIRDATNDIVEIVETLNRKMAILKTAYDVLTVKAEEYDHAIKKSASKLNSKSVGTQTDNEETTKETIAKEIRDHLEGKTGWDKLANIMDYTWPENSHGSTEVVDAGALRATKGDSDHSEP